MPTGKLEPFAHLRDPRFWIASAIVLTGISGLRALGALPEAAAFPLAFLGAVACTLLSRWRMRHERGGDPLRCIGCGTPWDAIHPPARRSDFCAMCGQKDPYPEERA